MPISDKQITEIGGMRVSPDAAIPPDAIEVRILGMFMGEVALIGYGTASPLSVLTTPTSTADGAAAVSWLRGVTGAQSDAEMMRRCAVLVATLLKPPEVEK